MAMVFAIRVGVGAALTAYFFVVFCVVRGLIGGVGWGGSTVVQTLAATAVMTAFVVWLAPLVELPEVWFHHRTPARRRAQGLCGECGYALPKAVPESEMRRCPECGAIDAPRPAWQFSARTARIFVLIACIAYAIGSIGAAWWIASDERAFRREAARASGPYERRRAWPADFAVLTFDDRGVMRGRDVLEGDIVDPAWRSKR